MFYSSEQIWQDAVVRNARALTVVVAQLVGLLAAYGGVGAARVPRAVHATVLRVLRPAEAALRRLIVIAARDVMVAMVGKMSPPVSKECAVSVVRSQRLRLQRLGLQRLGLQRLAFQLFDPRMRLSNFVQPRVAYAKFSPRVSFIAPDPPFVPFAVQPLEPSRDPEPEKQISARRMCFRLQALSAALADLPKQARRLAAWRVRRANGQRPSFTSPLRPGRPPGFRKVPMFDIDLVLDECHRYADGVLASQRTAFANTS